MPSRQLKVVVAVVVAVATSAFALVLALLLKVLATQHVAGLLDELANLAVTLARVAATATVRVVVVSSVGRGLVIRSV